MKLFLRTLSLSASLLFASTITHAQSAAVHGMVLFGSEQLYLSHIPMYRTPHDHQALIKVSLSTAGLTAYNTYNTNARGQQYFTLAPKPFVLPQLLAGKLTSFKADLYRGSFEQGGRVIAPNVIVTVEKIEYQSRLLKTTAQENSLIYMTLESGETSYLAHKITAPNNFDHIVQIKWLNQKPTGDLELADNTIPILNKNELTQALPANDSFIKSFDAPDSVTNRLKNGQMFSISSDGSIEEVSSEETASFEVISDFYCTKGPDFYNKCS